MIIVAPFTGAWIEISVTPNGQRFGKYRVIK